MGANDGEVAGNPVGKKVGQIEGSSDGCSITLLGMGDVDGCELGCVDDRKVG